MTNSQNPDDIRNEALADNTAQGVHKILKALESTRKHSATRWIWELLQNARDVSGGPNTLIASIDQSEKEIVFQHNGADFTSNQICHLIYHGSTKNTDNEPTIGQYGSGFLTTHLLSPTVIVSGSLKDGRYFEFSLKRDTGSVDVRKVLKGMMDQAWDEFNAFNIQKSTIKDGFTTRFRYPIDIDSDEVDKAVHRGLAELMRCAPLVMVFNHEFSQIKIQSSGETTSFIKSDGGNPNDELREITIEKTNNDKTTSSKYLLKESDGTSVAVPFETTDTGKQFQPLVDIPKIFLGFPLVGTANFSFPAIVNSFKFTPTEERDGVRLGLGNDPVNIQNQEAIKESCELLIRLIDLAANSGWRNAYELATVPDIPGNDWLDPDYLRNEIKKHLVEKIRQTSAVVGESRIVMKPSEAMLPLADTDDGVEILWELLNGLRENQEVLPRQEEAVGWCRALKSWATIYKDNASTFDEAMNGKKVAETIDKKTRTGDEYGKIKDLQCLLCEDVRAIEWLDQLHDFLNKNNLLHEVKEFHIVPAQDGCLDKLSNLHCDQDIDEELKDIAELLGWKIRQELRDTQIFSLANESGAGIWDGGYVVQQLVQKLKERADSNPDSSFGKASVRLFAWIANKKDWRLLRDYPAISRGDDDGKRIIKLEQAEEYKNLPLAPVSAWAKDIQEYATLFPSRYTLSDEFFKVTPDLEIWQALHDLKFISNNVIFEKQLTELDFSNIRPDLHLSDEDKQKHKSEDPVTVTDIAFLTKDEIGIMSRLPKSQKLARLFWRFLTEWLVDHDTNGLTKKEAPCACGEPHNYYPAKWLMPLANNYWVPLGDNKTSRADAHSIAILLQDDKAQTSLMRDNVQIDKFLDAIGVQRFDLVRETLLNDEDSASAKALFTKILTSTGGNVKKLEDTLQYAKDLEDDSDLPNIIDKRRNDKRIVSQNKALGEGVESLVKEAVESKGFSVTYTRVGSDFEIGFEIDAGQLHLAKKEQKWLVEVKATRGQDVRMTTTQAKESVNKKDRFLLCVVPVESDDIPELDAIRSKMLFVENIGDRMDRLCKDLDGYKQQREDIMIEKGGVQLVVVAGVERFQVNSSLWKDGLTLEELVAKLSQQS